MASYSQVSKGSSGDDVLQLQKILNQNGYKLTEDGIFGDNTLAAVKDYQTKNGLTVDGIVGNNTWGALTSSNKSSGNTSNTSTGFSYDDFTYNDYAESDTVKQANAALKSQIAAKPGEYQSQWQKQIKDIIGQITNREEFSYDVNSDALYQQYKEQYASLGKLAMQDTMGQAAAMTGGYGSSYASAAGNQAYQAYLSQLNEVVPELYGMALDKYNAEGQELYNQYGLLTDQESQDYGRYQDKYNQWASERDHLQGVYDSERAFDYSKYVDDRNFEYGKYSDDRNLEYSEYRNAIADEQWQKEYDESVRQHNETLAENKRQFNESMAFSKQQYEEAKASGGGSGGSGSSGSNNAALQHVASMSSAEIVETMQAYNYDEDNTGLAAFLDDCVASGRLTEGQADEYYAKYRIDVKNEKNGTSTDILKKIIEAKAKGMSGN